MRDENENMVEEGTDVVMEDAPLSMAGWCWINGDRMCNQSCMAYAEVEGATSPCVLLRAAERVPDSLLMGQDEAVQTSRTAVQALNELTTVLNNLTMRFQGNVRF